MSSVFLDNFFYIRSHFFFNICHKNISLLTSQIQICTKVINKMLCFFMVGGVDFMLNELLIVYKSKTHAGNLQNEANHFLGLSPGRDSQT